MRVLLLHSGGALALAASLVIAACGDDEPSTLATLAPPDAPLYAEAVIRPEGDQAEAVESFADRVAGLDDPGAEIVSRLDEWIESEGVDANYSDDIEPWLGERGALFVRSFEGTEDTAMIPDLAVMLQVTDTDAAQEFIDLASESDPDTATEERSYEGFDYQVDLEDGGTAVGLIDDALVLGTEAAFQVAADAREGESLDESEEYSERIEALGDGLVGSAFLEPAAAIEAAIAAEGIERADARMLGPLLSGPLSQPVALGLSATPDAASLDVAAMVDDQDDLATDPALIESLPADSWLGVAVPDLGLALERVLDQLQNGGLRGARSITEAVRSETGINLRADLIDWLGDAAAFVEGTSVPGFTAGVIAEISDPEAPRKLLGTVQRLAERDSGLRSAAPPEGADYGFSLGLPGLGGGAEAGVVGDRLVGVVGATVAQVLDPSSTLGEDPRYRAAVESLGEEFPAGLYLHLPSFFEVAEQGSSGDDPDYGAAEPYLDGFESLVGGTRVEDGLVLTRITVSLAQ